SVAPAFAASYHHHRECHKSVFTTTGKIAAVDPHILVGKDNNQTHNYLVASLSAT
ncbi:MAG: hypothetical protein QOG58_5937, partial [Caballeronia sp.]|nr:hypothetical protein [Caballeronia sp.]